ncbi:MAG TPA: glucose-1-phosphate adenylyltransferase [Thermomicrobiales bacterium]|nr:glucose-1-phosphate adenylyltransferase [Thermomicrobiales bacterium]
MAAIERDKTVAMILAGGQGERLSVLSRQRAKPAVMFAGKYRIIDFALSNCVNSGIYDVAVLTQYRPHSLNDHIGHGRPWDLDRATGGVHVLQPYLGRARSDWYRGTADAIYHNLFYVEETRATDVLILSGDHVYAMDYRPMLARHRELKADVTVAVQPVPWDDASRFGVMTTDDEDRVIDFDEKPAQPRSNLASMGVYVFRTEVLLDVFRRPDSDRSMIDFGHEVIPFLISDGNAFAHRFSAYWRDVGTLQSYWEANMEQLADVPGLNLYDPDWRMHTRSEERPPTKIMDGSHVSRALLSNGCIVIRGTVEHSVLSPGVIVHEGAIVRDSIIMTDTEIGPGAVIDRCIVDKVVRIGAGSRLGVGDDFAPNWLEPSRLNTGLTIVGRGAHVPANVRAGRNVLIAPDVREADFESLEIISGETIDPNVPVWS